MCMKEEVAKIIEEIENEKEYDIFNAGSRVL